MFYTKFTKDKGSTIYSATGSSFTIEYKREVDNYGSDVLVEVGKHNLYAEIQSYESDTDLLRILEMLPGLERPVITDEVIDLTKIPRTLGNWLNFSCALDDYWNSLSAQDKANIGSVKNLPDFIESQLSAQSAQEEFFDFKPSEQKGEDVNE